MELIALTIAANKKEYDAREQIQPNPMTNDNAVSYETIGLLT